MKFTVNLKLVGISQNINLRTGGGEVDWDDKMKHV